MKTDINGCSTCPPGEERWLMVRHPFLPREEMCMYVYRTPDGELFRVNLMTLEACRAERDKWLATRKARQ